LSASNARRSLRPSNYQGNHIVSDYHSDDYEAFEDQFDPVRHDRHARRTRKPRIAPKPKKAQADVVSELADAAVGLESGFETTYQPSKYEGGWLLQSLESLYNQQLITDVLALVKGGKEASVYCCAAHESTGQSVLAAKVYRPRMFRQLRNDKVYRQGRDIIMSDGLRLNASDDREMRAIAKGTAFGKKVSHTSWLMYEYTTLKSLYEAGAAVPHPWAVGDNVILMEYIGDENIAAPMLNTIRLGPDEVEPLFDEVMRNIDIMLQNHWIHSDLSAYNILYWEGKITLIDFPQVTDSRSNPDAHFILQRDIVRICEYFAQQGLPRDPLPLVEELWYRYGSGDLFME
jgi:RIO kinase 1